MTTPTKCDNRVRVDPELWRLFLDKCAQSGVPYKVMMETLITLYILDKIGAADQSREVYVPTQIPQLAHDSLVDSLLDGGLFS